MRTRGGYDGLVVDAFIFVPPVTAVAWLLLLSGRFNEGAAAIVWLLAAFALRPVIWDWASKREGLDARRAAAYRERKKYSTDTAFVATAILGLAALDVVRLPGAPYWTDQPRASFALGVIAVYLVWLALSTPTFSEDIRGEVVGGWRDLLGRRREGTHA